MAKQAKTFLVSTADFAYYIDGVLACTGNTNLNTSLDVSMQEQTINGGKGNQLLYSFKYGRELAAALEAADWKLEYIAANVGTKITEGFADVYKMGDCLTLTAGVGTLSTTPVGDVAVELPNGSIVMVEPDGATVDLTDFGLTNETVRATYKYSRQAKTVIIDADSTPYVGELVMDADKHNNKLGKVGSVQIIIPSYQLNGNFSISFTADGVTSTNLEGKALAVEGDACSDGSAVYAYIKEFDDTPSATNVYDIAATPATINLNTTDKRTATISVVGLKGALYAPVELENTDCSFVSGTPGKATVDTNGVVTAVASGTSEITVTYDGKTDTVNVVVS